MSLPRRRQRAADAYENATNAIKNRNSYLSDDRYHLLSDSLAGLSQTECIELVKLCIDERWTDGLSMLVSRVCAKELDREGILFYAVRHQNLTNEAKFRMVSALLAKGCSVNGSRCGRNASWKAASEYVVVQTDAYPILFSSTTNECPFKPSRIMSPLAIASKSTTAGYLDYGFCFSQELVRLNLPHILKFILPNLSPVHRRLTLVEALGRRNRNECGRILIDQVIMESHRHQTSWHDRHPEVFAIFLCSVYGHETFLRELVDHATALDHQTDHTQESLIIRSILNTKFEINQISPSLSKNKTTTALEAAVFFNHPHCVDAFLELPKLLQRQSRSEIDSRVATAISLLDFCAEHDFFECAKMLLKKGWKSASLKDFQHILSSFLRPGRDAEVISRIIQKMKKMLGARACEGYLNSLLSHCANNCWWRGLSSLAASNDLVLDRNIHMKTDAERTLLSLVSLKVELPIIADIVRSLAVFTSGMDLEPSIIVAVRNEHVEFLKLFLPLNSYSVRRAVKKAIGQTKNIQIQRMLEDALPPCPYATLGVARTATTEDIKKAYKQAAFKWHPDKHPSESKQRAEKEFKKILEAYETLRDQQARELHDFNEQTFG